MYLQLSPGDVRALHAIGVSMSVYAGYMTVLTLLNVAVLVGVATVLMWRRSATWMAMFVSFLLVALAPTFFATPMAALVQAHPIWHVPVRFLQTFGVWCGLVFGFLFPSGRFVPRWTRVLAILAVVPAIVMFRYASIFALVLPTTPMEWGIFVLFWGLLAAGIGAQFYRYRYVSGTIERQQIKWIVFGFAVAFLQGMVFILTYLFVPWTRQPGLPPIFLYVVGGGLNIVVFVFFVLSFPIAILRYRLFEIDAIISRTLLYVALTTVLAVGYFGSVIVLQHLFRMVIEHESAAAVVLSTLGIAALFNPLRRHTQAIIDWRFYRRKYDAEKALAEFGRTIRDDVNLDDLADDLLAVVEETLQPAHLALWLKSPVAMFVPLTPQRSRSTHVVSGVIAPDDPILALLQRANSILDVGALRMESAALTAMHAAHVIVAVPLVSQGELIGIVGLGPRRSEQEYSVGDRRLLGSLAAQAAPALRVAQLVNRQQVEARERERIEQELRVARVIQQTLLPAEAPQPEGWTVASYYQPARAVGGDFYDFYTFEDGCMGLVIGDVTDKGIPAALVMATTRAVLRSAIAHRRVPGDVLRTANELLWPDMPSETFVTCFYGTLDPRRGRLRFANAGHTLPCRRTNGGVETLLADGTPLGLTSGVTYEEAEVTLQPGDAVLLYSDGLVESHAPTGEVFGVPRIVTLLTEYDPAADLIGFVLDRLTSFTGAGWQQKDDITLVSLTYHTEPG